MKTLVFSSAIAIFLAGCVAAPGHRLDQPPADANVEIKPITAQLIQEQRLDRYLAQEAREEVDFVAGANEYEYQIGPHDVLGITVYDHPELTIPAGEFRSAEAAGHLVDDNGMIFFPYAGEIKVADRTMPEVRQLLTSRLSETIRNPQVDVKVVSYRSQLCYITGEVATPGAQAVTDRAMTLVDAVAHAGQMTEMADMANATLTQNGVTRKINLIKLLRDGDLRENAVMRGGDILHIPSLEEQKIFITGEVVQPQTMYMREGSMTLSEALSDAGGVDRITSNPGQIYVIRGDLDKPKIFHLSAKSADALLLGEKFQLESRDIVYVDTAGVTRWNRVINQILPTASVVRDTSALGVP